MKSIFASLFTSQLHLKVMLPMPIHEKILDILLLRVCSRLIHKKSYLLFMISASIFEFLKAILSIY